MHNLLGKPKLNSSVEASLFHEAVEAHATAAICNEQGRSICQEHQMGKAIAYAHALMLVRGEKDNGAWWSSICEESRLRQDAYRQENFNRTVQSIIPVLAESGVNDEALAQRLANLLSDADGD